MANWWHRVADFVFGIAPPAAAGGAPAPARAAPGRPVSIRSYAAARLDNLVASWPGHAGQINDVLATQLERVRNRSRQWCRDNPYGRRYVQMCLSNIVGPAGPALSWQPRTPGGDIDRAAAAMLEAAWWRWAMRDCDAQGRMSFVRLLELVVSMCVRDGEVLVRRVRGAGYGVHRYALQVIAADRLDMGAHHQLDGGHRVVMGVELDPQDRAVAYWLRPPARGLLDTAGQAVRVPAREIWHIYRVEEAGQVRGVPWPAAVLTAARHLEQYDEAALVAANVGAAKMGFFRTPDGDAAPLADGEAGGDLVTEVQPGHFGVLPPGYDFQVFDPDYPHQAYPEFVAAQLRRIASGLNVSYASLTADRSRENYSSIRTGALDERDVWMSLQDWLADALLYPLASEWLGYALAHDPELRRLPYTELARLDAPTWTGRRWPWVDPAKDMAAAEAEVRLGIRSRAQLIRERGGDPEQVWAELAEEAARGMPLPAAAGAGAAPAQGNAEE